MICDSVQTEIFLSSSTQSQWGPLQQSLILTFIETMPMNVSDSLQSYQRVLCVLLTSIYMCLIDGVFSSWPGLQLRSTSQIYAPDQGTRPMHQANELNQCTRTMKQTKAPGKYISAMHKITAADQFTKPIYRT